MKLRRLSLALILLVLGAGSASAQLVLKQVAAPPADIESGVVRLPERSVERSRAVWLPLEWQADGAGWHARVELVVERAGELTLALVGPDARRWSARAAGAGFAGVSLSALAQAGRAQSALQALDELAPGWDALAFVLDGALPTELVLDVLAPPGASPASGFVVAGDGAPPTLASALEGLRWTSDRALVFSARLEDLEHPEQADAALDSARVELTTGQGTLTEPLLDDGVGADELAGDGTYTAAVWPRTIGPAFARVVARGRDARGAGFLRSSQHALSILAPRAELTGRAVSAVLDATTLALDVEVASATDERLQLSFEVWGERPGAGAVPIVWLGRMSTPRAAGLHTIRLALDGRWLNAAGAARALELRHVRLQDPDTHVVLDELERLPLAVPSLPAIVGGAPTHITADMLSCVVLAPVGSGQRFAAASAPVELVRSLMLVHGYCAGGSPWPPAHFSAPKCVFVDANQNRSHDQFAQLLAAFAATQGLDSFGVVAHSQGGAAALHLLTFYQSGLESSFGGRRIQSVGTPYQGTPLASLGFFACGTNADMTPAGSAAWLASIPSWARAQVHYWTTSNSGSACNFFTNLILASPNDGVIEMTRGQLPGADNRGHTLGWCHSTGMSNPAHYTDATRNTEMNAQAAR